jgi:cyclohexanone monooxygenase
VVTDQVGPLIEGDIRLQPDGELVADILAADMIVLATGLNLNFMNEAQLSVVGRTAYPPQRCEYRGMLFGNVPNLAHVFGCTNASFTLKRDLTGNYVCRPPREKPLESRWRLPSIKFGLPPRHTRRNKDD